MAADGVDFAKLNEERRLAREAAAEEAANPTPKVEEEPPVSDGDFFRILVGALQKPPLRLLALQALRLLALRWEYHPSVFDSKDVAATAAVVALARGGAAARRGAAAAAAGKENGGGNGDGPEGEGSTVVVATAGQVLSNLTATRELKRAARHALPLPARAAVAVDAADIAKLSSALVAPSVDTVRVAVTALATLSASHSTNRDKLAARHPVSALLALAQSEIIAVQRDALRTLGALALQHGSKEELLAEGGLSLFIDTLESTLDAPPSSPRLRTLQHSRLLSTRRLAASALANLSEGHLLAQEAICNTGAPQQILAPIQRHNAALLAKEVRANTGPPRSAAAAAAVAAAEVEEGKAYLDGRSREHLLRCLANLALNETTHDVILESALLPELPPTARRGSAAERRSCALAMANLAPNPEAHAMLTNAGLLRLMIEMIAQEGVEGQGAALKGGEGATASPERAEGAGAPEGGGGQKEGGTAGDGDAEAARDGGGREAGVAAAAGGAEAEAAADEAAGGADGEAAGAAPLEAHWADEEEEQSFEPGGASADGEQEVGSISALLLQCLAELSASEETHDALVSAGVVGALLPIASLPHIDHTAAAKPRRLLRAREAKEAEAEAKAEADAANARRMEAIVTLANLAENPDTHDGAFAGSQGAAAFELFVTLLRAPTPEEQREGFRALSCLALARSRAAATTGGGAIDDSLMALLLSKARAALEPQEDGRATDEEVAFHAARALSLLSSNQANQRKIVAHGGLPIMYALARQADTDIQAEAATVIANVTSSSWEAQLRVCADGVLQLLLYLAASEHSDVCSSAARAIANLTQNLDNEPALRAARCEELLFRNFEGGSADVKWQSKRALANLEAARMLVGLRKYGGASVTIVDVGEVAAVCKHADAANVGAQREVGRALANLAAASANHALLLSEGGLALCMDLVVSNSAEVQQQATRCLANLALSEDAAVPKAMVDEGVLELLVLLAASWDEGVQEEAAVALANFAARPAHITAVVQAGALAPLVEQLKSSSPAVRYHGAMGLMAIQGGETPREQEPWP